MSLENFGSDLNDKRPFASDRVSEPRLSDPDVVEIHQPEFERLIRRVQEVTSKEVGRGVMILGDAGVGKSHLLGRFYRWSNEPPGATAVFLHNLLVAPERLPRYLLASTVSVLTGGRRDYEDCAFYRLWEAAVRKIKNLAPEATIQRSTAEEAIAEIAETSDPMDRAIRKVLLRVGLNMHHAFLEEPNVNRELMQAGLDWLAGETLDPDRADLLNLPATSEIRDGLRDDQDVEHVFRTISDLSRLAGRPFILCIDQFDNLSEAQVQATTRFFHVLIDHIPNLLCVLSGVSQNVLDLLDRGVIPDANWDRVAEERVDLRLVEPHLALRVVQERIDAFRAPFEGLPELRAAIERDPLFPLRRETFTQKLGTALRVRPRQMIRWARDAWDVEVEQCRAAGVAQWLARWPDGEGRNKNRDPEPNTKLWERLVEETVDTKRRHEHQRRLDNPGSLPASASNQEELLRRLLGLAVRHPQFGLTKVEAASLKSGYQLRLTSAAGDVTGVAFVVTAHASSSTLALRRLALASESPNQLVLVEDERRPIKRTDRALEYLEKLEERGSGFAHFSLDLDTHARLDALVSVLLQAKSGDIEVEWNGEMRTLTEDEVLEAFVRTRALESVPLLSALVAPRPAEEEGPGGSGPSHGGSTHPPTTDAAGPTDASPLRAVPPLVDPAQTARFLLGLVAAWPTVSVEAAAHLWCREHPDEGCRDHVEAKLTEAARRLSLAGQADCLAMGGSLRVTRIGLWTHVVTGLIGIAGIGVF